MPRILITRSSHQASPLADALRAAGLEPVLIPAIEIAPPTTFAPLDAALARLDSFHWIVFTSANAVEAFSARASATQSIVDSNRVPQGFSLGSQSGGKRERVLAPGRNPLPSNLRIAAIGPATARALELLGTKPHLLPPQAVAESLAAALVPHAMQPDGTPTCFLLPQAESARAVLPDALRAAGAEVTVAAAYRTVIPQESRTKIHRLFHSPDQYPDAITFTSSSSVTNLLALVEVAGLTLPPEVLRISIGPVTSQTLRDLNLPPHTEADAPSVSALVEKVVKALSLKNQP